MEKPDLMSESEQAMQQYTICKTAKCRGTETNFRSFWEFGRLFAQSYIVAYADTKCKCQFDIKTREKPDSVKICKCGILLLSVGICGIIRYIY